MLPIEQLKELEAPETPIFLFDCTLTNGDVQRWSTHKVALNGNNYSARVLKHNLFELRSSSDEATDGVSKVSLTLANADSFFSPIERTTGWKGAQLTVKFLFYDFQNGVAASNTQVLFRGTANPPDESTESYLRLSFTNRLGLTRVFLPEVRIQKRCPWAFPTTAAQLTEAVDGGSSGSFSPFYRCGYSAGIANGSGNLNAGQPFTSCDYSRTQCEQRGMFDKDATGNPTRRFGGIEFVPASILVRSYGEKGSHVSSTLDNQARYNDFIPLIYGTGWYLPPIVFARNDGNLTRTEVLLGTGEIARVVKVIVNGIEIPEAVQGANMTATGWYKVVTLGTRTGVFNLDFTDATGKPLGDPYGSLACLSVVVPNRISDGRSLPQVEVLIQGLKVPRFDATGALVDIAFTNNPAWVLLDVLRRSGWSVGDVDPASFARMALRCDELVSALDLHGNSTLIPRFQCNLLLTRRRSAADIVRGIRSGAGIYLTFNSEGLLQANGEDTLATQQPLKPTGSNSVDALNGGWAAYEFGDNAFSGILRRSNGEASFRTWSRTSADSPNFFTVEFQDEFNEYQQDSLSLVDLDDSLKSSQEITSTVAALGIPNFDQATRVTSLYLNKSVLGNTYIDFETSVKSVDLRPGDLIAISYSKEGWDRQPFRVIRIAPASNYRSAAITAQIHDDVWYTASGTGGSGTGRQPGYGVSLPRPLLGTILDDAGQPQFGITETSIQSTDGSVSVQLTAEFINPVKAQAAGSGIPLIGLNAQLDTTSGSLSGGQNLYYGVTSITVSGEESALSFLVKAAIPAGTSTNQVTLPSLSFPPGVATFNIYRGPTPSQLLQIGTNLPIASTFTDSGLPAKQAAPPDMNFDHANFYWRIELQPEEPVDKHSPLTVGNSTLNMLVNEYSGATVRLTKGVGAGQERLVMGNSATTISTATAWNVEPDNTSAFTVSESGWQFGATGTTSPISFEVPNRAGTTLQISGRSANVRNDEAAYELSPLTRWRVQGDGGGTVVDGDVPPAPVFGLSPIGQGTVEIQSVSFSSYQNTKSISAGTLTLGYWDELQTPTSVLLGADLDSVTSMVTLAPQGGILAGALVQVDAEVMSVQLVPSGSGPLTVRRGAQGTVASPHSLGSPAYVLAKKLFVLPFARDFFGSLASGSYAYPVYLPDVRIAYAELFMTNSQGNSDVKIKQSTSNIYQGLRTLSGGQLSMQVEGMLAIQTDATPPLIAEASHSVRDVFATLGTAGTGSPVQLQITQNGVPYGPLLTIPPGSTTSNVVDGFLLGPLTVRSIIGLNIVAVSQTFDTLPGSDLTVTIRF